MTTPARLELSEALQIAVSTAEEQRNYSVHLEPSLGGTQDSGGRPFPSGTYRVVNGELLRVLPGAPPDEPAAPAVVLRGK